MHNAAPWSVEQQDACFVVRDHGGQALTYVYYEDEPGRRSAAKRLMRQEPFEVRFAGLCLPIAKSTSSNRRSDWQQPNSLAAFRKAFTTSSGFEL